jgi:hypothetical protein
MSLQDSPSLYNKIIGRPATFAPSPKKQKNLIGVGSLAHRMRKGIVDEVCNVLIAAPINKFSETEGNKYIAESSGGAVEIAGDGTKIKLTLVHGDELFDKALVKSYQQLAKEGVILMKEGEPLPDLKDAKAIMDWMRDGSSAQASQSFRDLLDLREAFNKSWNFKIGPERITDMSLEEKALSDNESLYRTGEVLWESMRIRLIMDDYLSTPYNAPENMGARDVLPSQQQAKTPAAIPSPSIRA